MHDSHAGPVLATCGGFACALAGWMVDHSPLLQAISYLMSIVSFGISFVYIGFKLFVRWQKWTTHQD